VRVGRLGRERFIGDTATMTVHDTWHEECEGCLVDELVDSGRAVGFSPDTLDEALLEDFEPCEYCFDRSDPAPPDWAERTQTPGAPGLGRQALASRSTRA